MIYNSIETIFHYYNIAIQFCCIMTKVHISWHALFIAVLTLAVLVNIILQDSNNIRNLSQPI